MSALHPAVDPGVHQQQVTDRWSGGKPRPQLLPSDGFFPSACSDFVSRLTDDSLLLLINEAVAQLALGGGDEVGGASVRLMLLMANQQELRVRRCLLSFRGRPLFGFKLITGQNVPILVSDRSGQLIGQRLEGAGLRPGCGSADQIHPI